MEVRRHGLERRLLSPSDGTESLTSPDPAAVAPPTTPDLTVYPEWMKDFPDELKTAPAMKPIKDIQTLAKSYLNAQKLVGADKIPLPGKHSTPEEWRQVYHKLGLPEKKEEYKINLDPDVEKTINKEFIGKLVDVAHTNGVLPQSMQAVLDFFIQENKAAQAASVTEAETANAAANDALKKEWGQAYETKFGLAKKFIKEFADPKDVEFLESSGLNTLPEAVRFFAKAASKMYGEAAIVDAAGSSKTVLSPKDAQDKIVEFRVREAGALYDKSHPAHEKAVKELEQLHKMAYPE